MTQLTAILSPVTIADFFGIYWSKEPLLVVKENNFDYLLTPDDINDFFQSSLVAYPYVRIVGNGDEIDSSRYLFSENGVFKVVNRNKFFQLFEEGNSIVIQACQYQFPKIRD